jgi:hypothetical protein
MVANCIFFIKLFVFQKYMQYFCKLYRAKSLKAAASGVEVRRGIRLITHYLYI